MMDFSKLRDVMADALLDDYQTDAGTGCDDGPVPYVEGQPHDMADTLTRVLQAHGLVLVDPEATHQELIVCTKAPGPHAQGAVMREGFPAWAQKTTEAATRTGSRSKVWTREVWASHWRQVVDKREESNR